MDGFIRHKACCGNSSRIWLEFMWLKLAGSCPQNALRWQRGLFQTTDCLVVMVKMQHAVFQHPYWTTPRPGQVSSSTYTSDGECRRTSCLKSCLRLSVELITGTSSDSFSTSLSMSSCSVPKTGHGENTFAAIFDSCFNVQC